MDASYDAFDYDVLMQINSAFSDLEQLGIGPANGYQIEGIDEKWVDFLGEDPRLNSVKNYVFLKTKLAFDPPSSGYGITAIKEQIKELEWRITIGHEARQGGS